MIWSIRIVNAAEIMFSVGNGVVYALHGKCG